MDRSDNARTQLYNAIQYYNSMGADYIYQGIRYMIKIYLGQYRILCTIADPARVPAVLSLRPGVQVIQSISNLNMRELIMPDTVETVDGYALFNSANLGRIHFSRNLCSAGMSAFAGCHSLQFADMYECRLTELPKECFMSCASLKEIYLPKRMNYVGSMAFYGCRSLKYVHLPAGAVISGSAFAETKAGKPDSFGTGSPAAENQIGLNSSGQPVYGIYYDA